MALLDRSLREFLDDVAARGTDAGRRFRRSPRHRPRRGVAGQDRQNLDGMARAAGASPRRPSPCATARLHSPRRTAEEYEAALQAREDDGGEAGERRDFALGRAYARAAEPPLQIARAAADVAELAVVVARNGDPAFHADAVTAALLAAAAASSAAELVGVNLTASARDERVREAERLAESAARAAEEARAARE